MTKIFIASSNQHKVEEFSNMFKEASLDCQVFSAKALTDKFDPEENGTTFEENAIIKAKALYEIAPENSYIIADDSGLIVDALNGQPGIYSARYAGVKGENADEMNNNKLLENLKNTPDEKRTARFACAICLITPANKIETFYGELEGFIAHSREGINGFGYDPLFLLTDRSSTTAQLAPHIKNQISHRAKAFQQLITFLKNTLC